MQYVAYYRVSTSKQEASGLGLQAQQEAVHRHIGQQDLIAEFTETESGGKNDRQQLQAAIRHAKLTGSILIVAKLDRLSRNATFLGTLFDSGIPIICADMPSADRFTIGVMAQVAQWERETISRRTREALQAAKRSGKQLGTPSNSTPAGRSTGQARSIQTRKARAAQRRAELMPYVEAARAAGASTQQSIADFLNAQRVQTSRGGKWYAASVGRLLAE